VDGNVASRPGKVTYEWYSGIVSNSPALRIVYFPDNDGNDPFIGLFRSATD
jgi:hypothetical protein